MMKRVVILLLLANVVLYFWRGYSQNMADEIIASPFPADIERLVLLTEHTAAELESSEPGLKVGAQKIADPGSAKTVTTNKSKPVCYTFGPLPDSASVNEISDQLDRAGVQFVSRTKQVASKDGLRYLVFLPAVERQKAEEISSELSEKGVKDFYISGKNFIALGVFSKKELALQRAEAMQDLGYTAVIKENGVTHTEYWLDAMQGAPDLLTSGQRDAMAAKYAKAGVKRKDCREIALKASNL